MMQGVYDLAAWLFRRWATLRVGTVPPYRVEAGDFFTAGQAAGESHAT
jgi:hypothetical protein